MKGNIVLRLVVVTLSVYHVLSADGCGNDNMGSSVRCGDECTGVNGYCTCGDNAEKFDYRDNTTWCCNTSDCRKTGRRGFENILCKKGTLLPLTQPCQSECNIGKSYWAAREYWGCESKDQCIKVQYVQDGVQHCRDRSDERKVNQDLYSPIQWEKLRICHFYGHKDSPGVKCSGQGLGDDCMEYSDWCNERTVMKCAELGGLTSVHTEVCSNNSFWLKHPCTVGRDEGRRCNSEYSGQCYYPHSNKWLLRKTCRDRSHDILPLPDNNTCPQTYFYCLVENKKSCISEYLRCDVHPQCDDGADEKNCKHVYKIKRLTKASGTRTCNHLHYGPNNTINRPEVKILALSCDGEQECAGGVDEMCDPLLTRAQLCA